MFAIDESACVCYTITSSNELSWEDSVCSYCCI